MERRDDRRGEGVEVVDREVGLAADITCGAIAEDGLAQLPAGRPQAHALADAQEEAGDLGVAEHEVAAGLGALVTAVHVLARRAGRSGVGMVLGRLADGDRKAEGVALAALGRHAAIARAAMGVAPLAAAEAIQPDLVVRVLRAPWADDRRVGLGACHGPNFLLGRATFAGTLIPPRYNRGWSGREG